MGGDHICPICYATFTRPQHVGRHMRSHTGDKPYSCPQCPDRFARSDLLSRHIQKTHGDGIPPKPRKNSKAASATSSSGGTGTGTGSGSGVTSTETKKINRKMSLDSQQSELNHLNSSSGSKGKEQEVGRRASAATFGWGGQAGSSGSGGGIGYGMEGGSGAERGYEGGGVGTSTGMGVGSGMGMGQQYQQKQPHLPQYYQGIVGGGGGGQPEMEIDEEEDDWEDIPGIFNHQGGFQQFQNAPLMNNFFQQIPGTMAMQTQRQSPSDSSPETGIYNHGLQSINATASPLSFPRNSNSLSPAYIPQMNVASHHSSPFTPNDPLGGNNIFAQTQTGPSSAGLQVPSPFQNNFTLAQQMGMGNSFMYDSASPDTVATLISQAGSSDSPQTGYSPLSPQSAAALQQQLAMMSQSITMGSSNPGSVTGSSSNFQYTNASASPATNHNSPSSTTSNPHPQSERSHNSNLVIGHLPPEGSIPVVPPPNGSPMRSSTQKKHRACDQCNHSKVKCDFDVPCHKCAARGLSCTYPTGRKVSAARAAKLAARGTMDDQPRNTHSTLGQVPEGVSLNQEYKSSPEQILLSGQDESSPENGSGIGTGTGFTFNQQPLSDPLSAQNMARIADGRRASVAGPMTYQHQDGNIYVVDGTLLQNEPMPMNPTFQSYNLGGMVQDYSLAMGGMRDGPNMTMQNGMMSQYHNPRTTTNQSARTFDLGSGDEADPHYDPFTADSRRTSLASSFLEEAANMALDSGARGLATDFAAMQEEDAKTLQRPDPVRMPSLQDVKEAWRTYLAAAQAQALGGGMLGGSVTVPPPASIKPEMTLSTAATKPKARPGLPHRGRSSSEPPVFMKFENANLSNTRTEAETAGTTPQATSHLSYGFTHNAQQAAAQQQVVNQQQLRNADIDWSGWNQAVEAGTGITLPSTLPGNLGDTGGALGGMMLTAESGAPSFNGPGQTIPHDVGSQQTDAGPTITPTSSIPTRPIAGVIQDHSSDLKKQILGKGVGQTLAPERAPSFLNSPGLGTEFSFPATGKTSTNGGINGPSPLRSNFVGSPLQMKTTSQFTRPGNKRIASHALGPEHSKVMALTVEGVPGMTTSGSWDSIGSGPLTPMSASIQARRASVPSWLGSLDHGNNNPVVGVGGGTGVGMIDPFANGITPMKNLQMTTYPFMTPMMMDGLQQTEYGFPGGDFETPTNNGQFSFM